MNLNKSILIVDDDETLRNVIAYGFKKMNYAVFQAGSGNEALEILKAEKIRIVLSDVQMPNGTGFDLLKAVRELDAKFPVFILMTGYSHLSAQAAVDAGAHQLIGKPFNHKQLIKEIELVSNSAEFLQ